MRCLACNRLLSDYEATRKNKDGEFIDLCSHCISPEDYDYTVERESDIFVDSYSDEE